MLATAWTTADIALLLGWLERVDGYGRAVLFLMAMALGIWAYHLLVRRRRWL